MHLLFLTDNFPPEVNAPASRTFEHVREWVKAGHDVTVITGAPNFPKGKVFEGYRNELWRSEIMDGVRVIRVWTYIAANEGFLLRVLDFLSFMVAAILAAPFVRKADVVIGTSPQFFTVCAAYVVSRVKRIPFIFELRDLWPESIKAVGAMRESAFTRAMERLEMFLYRKAKAVVSVTSSFRDNLVRRGIDEKKIFVITNGVDIERFSPRPKDMDLLQELGLEGKFVAGYIGTHGLAHALGTILDAASLLSKKEGFGRVHFILLGDGAQKKALLDRAEKMGLKNVSFIDSVAKDQVVRYWSILDVSIIHLKKTELFTTVIPSKLFECMGMGLPVLHGVSGESAEIVEREAVGMVFEPENSDALVAGIERLEKEPDLLKKFQLNGIAAAKKYDRKNLALQMLETIKHVVKN